MTPQLTLCFLSLCISDVYLDPNEDVSVCEIWWLYYTPLCSRMCLFDICVSVFQGDNDDLYLEPTVGRLHAVPTCTTPALQLYIMRLKMYLSGTAA